MSGEARELTPDEIVADIEAMKPRKRKVTIYQSWPRMILERERKQPAPAASDGLPSVEALARALSAQRYGPGLSIEGDLNLLDEAAAILSELEGEG